MSLDLGKSCLKILVIATVMFQESDLSFQIVLRNS